MSTSNERVWCTTQLAKLSSNHSIGRTHSWRCSTFYEKVVIFSCRPGRFRFFVRFQNTASWIIDEMLNLANSVFLHALSLSDQHVLALLLCAGLNAPCRAVLAVLLCRCSTTSLHTCSSYIWSVQRKAHKNKTEETKHSNRIRRCSSGSSERPHRCHWGSPRKNRTTKIRKSLWYEYDITYQVHISARHNTRQNSTQYIPDGTQHRATPIDNPK